MCCGLRPGPACLCSKDIDAYLRLDIAVAHFPPAILAPFLTGANTEGHPSAEPPKSGVGVKNIRQIGPFKNLLGIFVEEIQDIRFGNLNSGLLHEPFSLVCSILLIDYPMWYTYH